MPSRPSQAELSGGGGGVVVVCEPRAGGAVWDPQPWPQSRENVAHSGEVCM